MVRQGDWKIVRDSTEHWELYNLKEDAGETNDLSSKLPEKVVVMNKAFLNWKIKTTQSE